MKMNERINEIYEFISKKLIYTRNDISISGKSYNSTLLVSILTALVSGKQLIIGEPGLGKTTTSEYVASLFYSLPLEVIWNSEIHGNPEQTEEKMIGRPNLGKLNFGEEEVIWAYFPQLPVKIVDEINRLPPSKQDILLDGIDRGIWKYLDEIIICDENCLFATANYISGTGIGLSLPLLDRFDVVVESKHPGAILSFELVDSRKIEDYLRNSSISSEINQLLSDNTEYETKRERLEELSELYSEYIFSTFGIKPLIRRDREKIRGEIERIKLDQDSEAFIMTFISEFSYCKKYGQKRIIDECDEGCHYSEYVCSKVKNCLSNRFSQSLIKYCKALAWFLDDRYVNVEHVSAIVPYVLAHRIIWRDKFITMRSSDEREDFIEMHLAKVCTDEILYRYREQSDKIKLALKLANRREFLIGDHPIYDEIRKAAELAHPSIFMEFYDYETKGVNIVTKQSETRVDEIASLYEEWLDAIKDEADVDSAYALAVEILEGTSATSQEIAEFSKRLANYVYERGFSKTGLFLSALVNSSLDDKITLKLGETGRYIDYIGYLNEKEVTIEGDAGNMLGIETTGKIYILGEVKSIAGRRDRIYKKGKPLSGGWLEWIKNLKIFLMQYGLK